MFMIFLCLCDTQLHLACYLRRIRRSGAQDHLRFFIDVAYGVYKVDNSLLSCNATDKQDIWLIQGNAIFSPSLIAFGVRFILIKVNAIMNDCYLFFIGVKHLYYIGFHLF